MKRLPERGKLDSLNKLKQLIEKSLSKIEVFLEDLFQKSNLLKNESIKPQESNIKSIIEGKKIEISQIENDKRSDSEKLNKIRAEINKKKGIILQIEKMKNELDENLNFEGGKQVTKCPTCTREISFHDAEKIKNHYNEDINALKSDINKSEPDIKKVEAKIQNNEEKINNIKLIIRTLQEFKEILEKKKRHEIEIEKNRRSFGDIIKEFGVSTEKELLEKFSAKSLEELREKINKSESEINSLNQLNNRIKKENGNLNIEIRELNEKKDNMIKLENEREEIEKIMKHIDKNRELVKGFITEYMVEKRLIHNIQNSTKRFLNHFTGGQYSNLNLISVDKGRGVLIEVFDEFSNSSKETYFLSGGDKVALGFALRMGISELMTKIRPTKDSPKKNPKISFMILDEPLAALDKSRRAQVLTTLESQNEFNQIFLITHTDIPDEISPHFVKISKNFENGLSSAVFLNKDKKIM